MGFVNYLFTAGLLLLFLGIGVWEFALVMLGVFCTVVAVLWWRYLVCAAEREKEEQRAKKLEEQIKREQTEKMLAHMEGLAKFHQMAAEEARKYQEAIAVTRQLGVIMQQSVYQEKKTDWAVLGGIAEGIAGPAAGIATAANAINDNAKIEAENAARREWGAKQNALYQDLANRAEQKRPTALSMAELQAKHKAILAWSPSTLFSLIKFSVVSIDVDAQTGAVSVYVTWKQNYKSSMICIDGALRAKLYTSSGQCAGCAYLVLPKEGTTKFHGRLSGICATPKPSDSYTVKIEPADLWELALDGYNTSEKTDNLTDAEHRKLVADSEAKFLSELTNQRNADSALKNAKAEDILEYTIEVE